MSDTVAIPVEDEEAAVLAECQRLAVEAVNAETPHCTCGGEPIFYREHFRALVPGHVYSAAGRAEVRITGTCEYHFDEIATEED